MEESTRRRSCDVRFWLTAGTGNLGVTPKGCTPGFYVLCFGGLPGLDSSAGIAEASVSCDVVPLKPPHLAELKSNNYMLNALTMMAAEDRGGTFGIGVDAQGFLTESCVLNVIVVGADKVVRTPPFEGILKGTTVRKCLELVERHLLIKKGRGAKTGGQQLVQAVSQEKITLSAARRAAELFLVAGDTHAFAVTSLDGHTIGSGRPGPVFCALHELLMADAKEGTEDHEALM